MLTRRISGRCEDVMLERGARLLLILGVTKPRVHFLSREGRYTFVVRIFHRFARDLDPQVIVISPHDRWYHGMGSSVSLQCCRSRPRVGSSYAGGALSGSSAFALVGRIPFDFIGGALG